MRVYRSYIGRTVEVELKSGAAPYRIVSVNGWQVIADHITGDHTAVRSGFSYSDLTPREQFRRLGSADQPEFHLMRALVACEAGSFETARTCLRKADCPLAKIMLLDLDALVLEKHEELAASRQEAAENAARRAYTTLLRRVSLVGFVDDPSQTVQLLREREIGKLTKRQLVGEVCRFREKHGATEFAKSHETVLLALASIKSEEQSESGRVTNVKPDDTKGLADALAVFRKDNPNVTDSPRLEIRQDGICADFTGCGRIENMDALAGLPLVQLTLINTGIEDLSALSRMPLTTLDISGTNVRNLEPLREMKTLQSLNLGNTRVNDLSPLKDLKLTWLKLDYAPIADLSPILSMPLTYLSVRGVPGATVKLHEQIGTLKQFNI